MDKMDGRTEQGGGAVGLVGREAGDCMSILLKKAGRPCF